jgi:CheY-like chemotaxis protein
MHILVVDDDSDAREMLGLILRAQGHEVEEAVDGDDALERIRRGSQPSLILLDLMMPRLDGEGFLTALRGEPAMANANVVIVSGHHSAHQKADQLGARGYLVKPIDLDDLFRTIHEIGARRADGARRTFSAR